MSQLYLIEYGCSICSEHLVVSADDMERAMDYAYQEAQSVYWSYDCNYPDMDECEDMTEEEINEMIDQEVEQDIHYYAEPYNPNNEDHQMWMRDQDNKPFEI